MRALLLVLTLLLAGCSAPPPDGNGTPPPPPPPPVAPPSAEEQVLAVARLFDGERALQLVAEQVQAPCAIDVAGCTVPNYRVAGTENATQAAQWIAAQMLALGWEVAPEDFTASFEGETLRARNIVATRAGRTNATLLFAAHYDTRPCADKDPDPARRGEPVLGANDGASGVAALLEMARVLRDRGTNHTLRFLFFDAEDMGDAGLGCGRGTPWAQGSAYHAGQLTSDEVARIRGLVLLDMVGDAALELRREATSAVPPHRALQRDLWDWAKRLGHDQFQEELGSPVTDDHAAFQARGIPAIDVIHLDAGPDPFPASHHTTFDDLAHVSAASLEAVGEAALAALLAWDAAGVPKAGA